MLRALLGVAFSAPFSKNQGRHPVFTPSEVEGLEKGAQKN